MRGDTHDPPRYLVDVDAAVTPQVFTDTLIIGSGVAGLRAALAASGFGSVLLVTKADIRESNTEYAQGGVAAVLSEADCTEDHVRDTLDAGGGLAEEAVVRAVVEEGPDRLWEVLSWGGKFDLLKGELHLTREGGHSRARVAHAGGDATGREFMNLFIRKVGESSAVVWERSFLIDLLTRGGECVGGIVQAQGGERRIVWAGATILASGGGCEIYRESTNPSVATGDGVAAAYRAGATVRGLEFVQFHPTVLYLAGAPRRLISEAVRGEGGVLRNLAGRRFMPHCHPDAELAPRDVVSQSIIREMSRSGAAHVLLDLTNQDAEKMARRFPGLMNTCESFGLDPGTTPLPVRPAAHYLMGGVLVDLVGHTSVPRLLACGEVTCSGLHGANRLGSNSLLEGLVFGARAGEEAGRIVGETSSSARRSLRFCESGPPPAREPLDLLDMQNSLKALVNRSVGVLRSGETLSAALKALQTWGAYVLARRLDGPSGWELQNMMTLTSLVTAAALAREESRGAHAREDFPERNDAEWRGHLEFTAGQEARFVPLAGENVRGDAT